MCFASNLLRDYYNCGCNQNWLISATLGRIRSWSDIPLLELFKREREGGVLGSAWNDWFSFRLEIPANNKEKEVVSYSSFLRNWLEVGRLRIILSTVCADGNACEVPISTSALCVQHGKTDRLRVKNKEAFLSTTKESDEWHEMLAPRRIPETVRTCLQITVVTHLRRSDCALSSFLWSNKCSVLNF